MPSSHMNYYHNLREILLLTDKNDVSELCKEDAQQIIYKEVPEKENWRISSLKELINVRCGSSELIGFTEKLLTSLAVEYDLILDPSPVNM